MINYNEFISGEHWFVNEESVPILNKKLKLIETKFKSKILLKHYIVNYYIYKFSNNFLDKIKYGIKLFWYTLILH
jgi:hypothetical protein